MYTAIEEKMKKDAHIIRALKERKNSVRKQFWMWAGVILVFALLLCVLAKFSLLGWIVTLLSAAVAVCVLAFVFSRCTKKAEIFLGKITRMEEDREIVPRKGSGAVFGTSHKYLLAEVYELLVAITDEKGETQVISCPPQHEKLLQIGDTLVCHSLLPYPAHLSNPTKCICMHCGTMQSAENPTCITCGADVYSIYTVQ